MDDALEQQPKPEVLDEYYTKVPYHWLYAGTKYGWWHFRAAENDSLEKAYSEGASSCVIYINEHEYYIDYTKMIQTSVRGTRSVLRVPSLDGIAFRGVAP